MNKPRSRSYVKSLKTKAVKYYFENPNSYSIKELAEKFNLTEGVVSKAISDTLKKRFENSFSRKYINK